MCYLLPSVVLTTLLLTVPPTVEAGDPFDVNLRYQQETGLETNRFHRLHRTEEWQPEQTAIIVCDVWDYHHCLNAVRRLNEFAPRLNDVLTNARQRGVTIIHAPSSCMDAYASDAARQRALKTPAANFLPHECKEWCTKIPAEERAVYPIDQSDGGEDDDLQEHAEWAKKLESLGRNPKAPWQRQLKTIQIDQQRDYITDRGDEIWNILQQKGIRNVVLTGVHTNMCVLGRPFGLRQMARNGKNVVLIRDLTDTMYNPQMWPYVNHFTGTDLIVSHIERHICPTITSDQFIGGAPFKFANDQRPHLVMLIAEDEYQTEKSLPRFAADHLGRDFRVTGVFGSDLERSRIPGIAAIGEADVLLVSVRRRVLPRADLQIIRNFVAAGKPIIGIRTASHAFSLRSQAPPEGFTDWPEFDAQVFGGNYHGHHGNDLESHVRVVQGISHLILDGITNEEWPQGGSLYKTSPLADNATVLATAKIDGFPAEPVAWTYQRSDNEVTAQGGRSFYTSLGHTGDFANPTFRRLLYQGICWAAGVKPTEPYAASRLKKAESQSSADVVFARDEPLWSPRVVSRTHGFTPGIEGPACDASGNIFAVNFQEQGTIGRISPDGSGEMFIRLSAGSVGNGIRFDRSGHFYVADYTGHNVLSVNPKTKQVTVFAHDDRMNQPNDLALAPDGTLYASDPNWKAGTGQLWRIDRDGSTTLLAAGMGTTNGLDVSPDGKHLYVNESKQRNVWSFDITADRSLSNKRLIRQFPDHGFDGMRCDVDGNLMVTRHGKGTVIKMTPAGKVLQEIPVLGSRPSNLCFGGPDGRTVYVTEVDGGRIVAFRTDAPGRSWGE